MPYVHLANGDVKKVTEKELNQNHEDSGSTQVFRMDGMEHHIIGVYPEEYEHPETDEAKAERQKQEDSDRAEFENWRANRDKPNNNPEVDWSAGKAEE
jgi:hypothetical protein